MGAQLAKGQIAAENGQSRGAEGICQGDEERRIAVRACAVRQDKAICSLARRGVQESPDWNLIRRSFGELSKAVHRSSIIRRRFPSLLDRM